MEHRTLDHRLARLERTNRVLVLALVFLSLTVAALVLNGQKASPPPEFLTARAVTIVNEKGLHARASAKLVELVEAFDAEAEITKDGMSASGDSIMGLLMLAAAKGTTIEVATSGPDAAELADALETLVASRFGEGV